MNRFSRPLDSSRHISDAGCFASDAERERIGEIDLHGQSGRNGQSGMSYRDPPVGSGIDGHRGGDAGPASLGQSGGRVIAKLSLTPRRKGKVVGGLRIDGQAQRDGSASQTLSETMPIGESGYLFIDSSGGKGGNGGDGGDGGPGSQGRRGRDATRFSSGSNGGTGGDGGDAGQPSDGARGGNGGDVELSIDRADTGLLMLVKGNLAGGGMGFAGEPGRGGHGGAGGPGGSSYHWTETESYTDSEGNLKTRIIHRSNPGGFSGSAGRDGRPSRYVAQDALPGTPGKLRIFVTDHDGTQTLYGAPYDLELVTFDLASEYTILEPDSLVSVDQLVVRNVGGMPTPANFTIRVFLDSDEWLQCDGNSLVMHHELLPGQTHVFETGRLRFRVGDHVIDEPRKRSFRLRHPVSPQARMESGIARPFRQFEKGEDIKVRFPIELSPVRCLNSLAPGESTRVLWSVKNIGDETFDQKHLYRAVRSRLRLLGGDLSRDAVRFFDDADADWDLLKRDFEKRVHELGPGQSQLIETRVGIKEQAGAIAYQGLAVGVDVDLQRPGSSTRHDEYRRVDYRKAFIRVSERYQREDGSRFLLIANEKTTTDDIDQWTQLADYFGSGLDVWDVSYYGFWDLLRDVENDESLLEQWAGMTVIVPNNYYSTPGGKTVAFEQLAKSQFLQAAADHDINFYIVGDSRTGGAEMLADSLIPVSDEKLPSQLKTQHDFLKAVDRWNGYVARSQDVVGGVTSGAQDLADVSLGAVHEFDIQRRTFLFQPKPEWLLRRARKLQRKLSKEDPLHRWIIVHRYDTGDSDTSWGFFKRRQIGKLEVRRTLDATKGSAVLYEVDGIDAIDEGFITSQANKHGIFLALKFEDKVDRFIRLVSERTFPRYSEKFIDRPMTDDEVKEIGKELVDSILTDLFNEQRNARHCRTWGRGGVRAIMPKLNYLVERSLNYGVTYRQMLENEVSLDLLYRLVANLHYMAYRSRTIWDSAWIPTSFFKRSRAVSKYMFNRADQIVTNIFGRAPGWWDRMTSPNDDYDPFGSAKNKEPDGIARQTADRAIEEHRQRLVRENPSIETYTTAQNHPGLTYDPELLGESVRVISGEQYDQRVAHEASATRRRYETETAIRAERANLLVPMVQAVTTKDKTTLATPQS